MRNTRRQEGCDNMSMKDFLCSDIPNEYQVRPCIGVASQNGCLPETAGLSVMHALSKIDDISYNKMSLSQLSWEYLVSADILREEWHKSMVYKEGQLQSYNPCIFIPCAYLCRHSLELKLKELICRLSPENKIVTGHDFQKLWKKLIDICPDPRLQKIEPVILDMRELDDDGMKLRYSLDKQGQSYSGKSYYFDADILVDNTKYCYKIAEAIIRGI